MRLKTPGNDEEAGRVQVMKAVKEHLVEKRTAELQ